MYLKKVRLIQGEFFYFADKAATIKLKKIKAIKFKQ